MKTFSVMLFLIVGAAPLCAQHYQGMSLCSCQQQRAYDASGVESDEQLAIEKLEKRYEGLNEKLESLEPSHDYLGDILELQDKLKQSERALHTAELRLDTAESRIEMLEDMLTRKAAATKPKAPTSKPKAPDR